VANRPFPGGPLADTPVGSTTNDIVDEPIGGSDNEVKDSPVGGTTNDLTDSPRAGSAGLITDLSPLPSSGGAAGYVPLDGTEPNIILGVNLNNDEVDVTGNHNFFGGATFLANKSYDGLRHMAVLPADAGRVSCLEASVPHQLANTSAVSFGGMYFLVNPQPNNVTTLLHSALNAGSQNYGLFWRRDSDRLETLPGGNIFSGTPTVSLEEHIHLAMTLDANRNTATVYINGVNSGSVSNTNGAGGLSTHIFEVGNYAGGANATAKGWVSDVFVCDKLLSDAEVLTFATNAFGGTPPTPT